jgi:hypothetical protein
VEQASQAAEKGSSLSPSGLACNLFWLFQVVELRSFLSGTLNWDRFFPFGQTLSCFLRLLGSTSPSGSG